MRQFDYQTPVTLSGTITPKDLQNYEKQGLVFLPLSGILHHYNLPDWKYCNSQRVAKIDGVDPYSWVSYWTGTPYADNKGNIKYDTYEGKNYECALPISIGKYLDINDFDTN